jgi:hypothetical protein
MAISGADKALMFALSGLARSGATRSNYVGTGVFITIGGIAYGDRRPNKDHRVLRESLTITDALNEEPNTCAMRTKGFVPPLGAEVVIRLGSTHNGRKEFAGRILSATQSYWDNPKHDEYAVAAIDYTWGLNQRKVTGRYTGSASTIAAQLLAQWAPGYSAAAVAPDLPVVDGGITFTHQDLTDCLTQLAKRVGASWYIDYDKRLHLFFVDTSATDPAPLTLAHPTARELAIERDASQWVTRAVVEAGGVTAMTDIAVGETLLPVDTIAWYPAPGGLVSAGPQHVRYGGVLVGGTGALVGTGAQPTGAPTAAPAAGGALEAGTHGYAFTYETAAGESLPGPTTFTDAKLEPPTTAPAVSTPGVGAGPDPGTHEYAVAFRTADGGETLVGPRVSAATGLTAPPATPPTPTATAGNGLPVPATFDYAVTFRTSVGETTPGPVSSTVSTSGQIANAPAPGLAGTGPNSTQGDLIPGNYYGYAVSWSTAPAQTTHSEQTGLQYTLQARAEASTANAAKSSHILVDVPYGPAGVTWCHLYRVNQTVKPGNNPPDFRLLASFANGAAPGQVRFTDTIADAAIASALAGSGTNTTPNVARVTVSNLPKGGASSGVTGRRVYRRQAGGAFGLVLDMAGDNTTTSFVDALATPGAAPPAVNTATALQLTLTAIPLGGPLVTDRALYRTAANASALRLLTYFGNNTTTTILDQYPDSALGGAGPTVPTAAAHAIQLASVAVGPTMAAGMVIARRLYRTAANSAALRFLARIADNVTTTYLDGAADASLGAAPPSADTSGLKQPEGSVNAGATSMPVSGVGWAPASGGWVIIGNGQQVIRYQTFSGNALTGIPAAGPGAITATIAFNSSVTVAAMLTGIPASGAEAIRVPIVKGDDINLIVILDDVASQSALAALIGGDGVQEEFVQDRRLSYGEAVARAEALLALRGQLAVRISFTSRDANSHSGRTLVIDLGAPFNLQATLRIQRTTASYALAGHPPIYAVEASTARFSFEDLLRLARLTRGT